MSLLHINRFFLFLINKILDSLTPAKSHFLSEVWDTVQLKHNLKKSFRVLIQMMKAQSHLLMLQEYQQKEKNKTTLKINFYKHSKVFKTKSEEAEILIRTKCRFTESKSTLLILDKHFLNLNCNILCNSFNKTTLDNKQTLILGISPKCQLIVILNDSKKNKLMINFFVFLLIFLYF